MDANAWSRFQFGFLITYHYLFPQLTMGLALIILIFKILAIRGDERMNSAARFWARIFGVNFAVGVVTGIPMEFQFGTNWAEFSSYSGGVIGLTLALEGLFAFFAESAFLGLFLFGEARLGARWHLFAAFMVFAGSWLSGYFIIVTNAFMQHPVGYAVGDLGALQLADMWGYLFNPWAIVEYLHNMTAAVITSSFVVAAVGAFYLLSDRDSEVAKSFMKVSVWTGLVACILILFPTGDLHGKMVAKYQPAALAGMEGKFKSSTHAELAIIGQPDVVTRSLANPIYVPSILSYLSYGSFGATVKGLDDFPSNQQPDNIDLLYFAYHIMVGLGTMFIVLMSAAAIKLRRGTLFGSRHLLWIFMLAFPFPYIATTMGWMSAELGRQPWVVYGLQRTRNASSPTLSGGSVVFSTLGFMGLYSVVGLMFLYLVGKIIMAGPKTRVSPNNEGRPSAGGEA